MTDRYSIGLDFGTNSVRCLIVHTKDGAEVGTAVSVYEHGEEGILLDPNDPNLAHPNVCCQFCRGGFETFQPPQKKA